MFFAQKIKRRNSGVISRNSGVIFWTESSADIEKFYIKSFDRNHEFCYFFRGAILRQALKKHGEQPTL